MGVRQPLRGNPEQKLVYLSNEFSRGVNLTFTDDLVPSNELRYIANFDLNVRGELRARKGFSKNTGLSELIFPSYTNENSFPVLLKDDGPVKNIILFKILENTNNSWRELSECTTLSEFQNKFCIEDQTIKTLVVAELTDGTSMYYVHKYVISATDVTRTTSNGVLPCEFEVENNLLNVDHGNQYGKVFFTSNDSGMLAFDNSTDTFSYIGTFTGKTNSAYKPHGVEIRKLGFNMLGSAPLTWIDSSGLSVESIQGVYLTTTDRAPINIIPAGNRFHINIIYTGSYTDFTISFSEFEEPIDADVVYKSTLSGTGIAVYEIELKTQPTEEAQIQIIFSNEAVELEPYIDYYPLGELSPDLEPITQLNIGDHKIVQMYDRLVYYKDNIIWFSEINRFDYIPNFNYVTLPIDASDEIVKIMYFRTGYIVFTRQRIYRLNGTFESSTLTLSLVNDDVGCISGNSVTMVENEMYFVSNRGLRSLKSDVFRENMENVREFDDNVYPIVSDNPNSYGFVYQDQYVLMSNTRGNRKTVEFGDSMMTVPDVLRQYYKIGAFVMDFHPTGSHPQFIFFESGQMYSFMGYDLGDNTSENFMYKYGTGFDDFDKPYQLVIQTAGDNLGYPLHEKKVKNVILKTTGEAGVKNIYVEVFANGFKVHDLELSERLTTEDYDIPSAKFRIDKTRLPSKFKNLAIKITTDSTLGLNLGSIAFIFKLGKVRE